MGELGMGEEVGIEECRWFNYPVRGLAFYLRADHMDP